MIKFKREIIQVLNGEIDVISPEYIDKAKSRIEVGFYSKKDESILKKAINLSELVHKSVSNNPSLEKANSTIRSANKRIEELKEKNLELESHISALRKKLLKVESNSKQIMSPYEVLGVTLNHSAKEIKKRYKSLSFIYHPDKCGPGCKGEMSKLINISYEKIS